MGSLNLSAYCKERMIIMKIFYFFFGLDVVRDLTCGFHGAYLCTLIAFGLLFAMLHVN